MKVHELIAHLTGLDQELEVAFRCFSEQCLLESDQIEVVEKCRPRPDGWIQDRRPDMPAQRYVLFPGN